MKINGFNVQNYRAQRKDPLFIKAEQAYRDKNFPQAVKLYSESLEKGNAFSAARIGMIYYYGHAEKRDLETAFSYFRKWRHDCPVAMMWFAYFLRRGVAVHQDEIYGRMIQEDNLDTLRLMAAEGDMWASYTLGRYLQVIAIHRDEIDKARELIFDAYKKGCDAAALRVAISYYYDSSVSKNQEKAYNILQENPMPGYGVYRYMVAICNICGSGTPLNTIKGLEEMEKALELGCKSAGLFLKDYYLAIGNVERAGKYKDY